MQQTSESYTPSAQEPYMCGRHLEYFRQKLLDMRRQVALESQEALDRIRGGRPREGDAVDQGLVEADMALALATSERNQSLLKQIDAALQRIDEGSYGYCEETGEEIGLRRLQARPLATLSVEAQEQRERMARQKRLH